ncbi:MAG: nicotinate (nicotinamide) nucleotide adenylyltransferase [Rikenellaceae bacterium]
MKRVSLYFGSYNPIHNGHIAIAEYVVEMGFCDELIMVVSPQNPLKDSADLANEMDRFSMAEIACAESQYPARIKASLIEFLLPKPSYTIDTLRHLSREYGSQMSFSLLMGGDIVEQLDRWRDYEQILSDYPILLYPRPNESLDRYSDRMTILSDAPQYNISSTEVRRGLICGESVDHLLSSGVAKYIADNRLWSEPTSADQFVVRGQWHYQHQRWGDALNDFNRAIALNAEHTGAVELKRMTQQILDFRYKDIYNP